MRMTIKFLQSRKGYLRYRRKVPSHLRERLGGRREFVRSLGLIAGQEALAVPMIEAINREVSKLLIEAERAYQANADLYSQSIAAEAWALANKFIGDDDSGRAADRYDESDYDLWLESILRPYGQKEPELDDLDPVTRMRIETVKRGSRVPVALTIGRASIDYGEHQQGGALKKAEATALSQLYEWIEARQSLNREAKGKPDALPMRKITRAHAREFVAHLFNNRGQAASTITRRVNSLKALWAFTADHADEPSMTNPWSRQKPPEAAKGQHAEAQKRLPFNLHHLNLIDQQLRSNSIDPNVRSIIRLLRATGCRPMEIGGLTKEDVTLEDDTPWIWVRANKVRRLKNKASQRRVPVLPDVVSDLRSLCADAAEPEHALFPARFCNTDGLSYQLNAAIREAGVPKSPRLVAYSFRHSLAEALRISGAPDFHAKAIMGHSDASTTGRYGSGGVAVAELLVSLQKATNRLGEVPAHVYRPEELVIS